MLNKRVEAAGATYFLVLLALYTVCAVRFYLGFEERLAFELEGFHNVWTYVGALVVFFKVGFVLGTIREKAFYRSGVHELQNEVAPARVSRTYPIGKIEKSPGLKLGRASE